MPKFADIPQLTSSGSYQINVGWDYLPMWLESMEERIIRADGETGLDMDPDFQRGHVWSEDKQIAYVEYILKGGKSSRDIYWNHHSWQRDYSKGHKLQLIDGKQRVQAVLCFLKNEIKAFGHFFNEYTDKMRMVHVDFIMHVNDLPTRQQVLQWYLDLNSGGVVHTEEELEKVRKLLEAEK
jgi:uncharacterized protein with ParB-like and HNH nuclease domain